MKIKQTISYQFTFIVVFAFFCSGIKAQEAVSYFGYPALKGKATESNKQKKALKASLELPFFDDFSSYSLYPDQSKWTDNYAFINGTYPDNPPSIGVATLDAINNDGQFYTSAGYGNFFSADTLSSQPINLNYPGDNSIYLSFYFQPQGLGDFPESEDSLFLEFYAPGEGTWEKIESFEGETNKPFQHVMVHINENKYLQDGFRFRFRNIASLSSNEEPSIVTNADHWHIDYVYLNNGRNASDLNPDDIAFVYPMASPLKNYEAMPWKHFKASFSTEIAATIQSVYQYNSTGGSGRLVDSIYYVFYDNSGNEPNDTLFGGAYNMAPGQQRTFDPPFAYSFLTNSADSASFTIKSRFVTDANDEVVNNELIYVQKFYDYYAYDDGSAEASYGIYGDGTQNARLAYQFDCKKQDTLKAIQMYFTRSLGDASQKYFYLTIWGDNEGAPGSIIYQREAVRPEYESGLNKFHDYLIDDTTLILDGVFYVGWVQTTSDMLNIGLDLNRNRSERIFYTLGGDWKNSSFQAALMIRPFFGKQLTLPVEPIQQRIANEVKVYPNPTKGNLRVSVGNISDNEVINGEVYTLAGRLVRNFEFTNNSQIELSGLIEGIYLLRVFDRKGKFNYTQKIIKTK
jgi:hypothetical protein